jgi:hypothetical protein
MRGRVAVITRATFQPRKKGTNVACNKLGTTLDADSELGPQAFLNVIYVLAHLCRKRTHLVGVEPAHVSVQGGVKVQDPCSFHLGLGEPCEREALQRGSGKAAEPDPTEDERLLLHLVRHGFRVSETKAVNHVAESHHHERLGRPVD